MGATKGHERVFQQAGTFMRRSEGGGGHEDISRAGAVRPRPVLAGSYLSSACATVSSARATAGTSLRPAGLASSAALDSSVQVAVVEPLRPFREGVHRLLERAGAPRAGGRDFLDDAAWRAEEAGLRPSGARGPLGGSVRWGGGNGAAPTLVGASPNSRLIEGERVYPKPCLGLLRGVLGLPAPLLGAAL